MLNVIGSFWVLSEGNLSVSSPGAPVPSVHKAIQRFVLLVIIIHTTNSSSTAQGFKSVQSRLCRATNLFVYGLHSTVPSRRQGLDPMPGEASGPLCLSHTIRSSGSQQLREMGEFQHGDSR
jgi:hypothetical protein